MEKTFSRRNFLKVGLATAGGLGFAVLRGALAQTLLVPRVYLPLIVRGGSVTMASSLTQYGITWNFDKAYPVGKFVNGDDWVVGPVTIVGITPASVDLGERGIVHGAMLNPDIGWEQGYDSRMFGADFADCGYTADLNVARPHGQAISPANPLVISTPASLISGISTLSLESGLSNQVRTMAVLTIVDAPPPANSFRPPYAGVDKAIRHTLADLDMSRLPTLTMPDGLSYDSFNLPNPDNDPFTPAKLAEKLAARFQRPWIEHMLGWVKEVFCPRDNMPNYGREIAGVVSDAALALTLDLPAVEKRTLAMRLAQYGLDTFGITQMPEGRKNWEADGGHHSGRAFPLIFAGYIFADPAITQVLARSGQYAYQSGYYAGHLPADYFHFGEIDQTFYVTERDIALDHSDADPRTPLIPYIEADLDKPEWGINHVWNPNADNGNWDAIYRTTCGISWSGYILASRILGIQNDWNHPPIFDYMDRYMELTAGQDARTANQFQARMWDTYRNSLYIS